MTNKIKYSAPEDLLDYLITLIPDEVVSVGIRALSHRDILASKKNDYLPDSHYIPDGRMTRQTLGGTSAITLTPGRSWEYATREQCLTGISDAMARITSYNNNYGYGVIMGDHIIDIEGNDPGEIIICNAKLVCIVETGVEETKRIIQEASK